MGQCYTVEARIIFTGGNAGAFCDYIRDAVRTYSDAGMASFQTAGLDMTDPFDCFRALTVPNAYIMEGDYVAEFSGSYGWESVMVRIFTGALAFAANGSEVRIFPDDAEHVISVSNGVVKHVIAEY